MIVLTQSIEIEFKNMLTPLEYEKIKTYFQLQESSFFRQENHYFDTPDFQLKQAGAALRIRKKKADFELTLKQPIKEGLLETNQVLTEAEAKIALVSNVLPTGPVSNLISEMNIVYSEIEFFGTLTTIRAEWEYQKGLLVLDYSTYLNTSDYELEYEVDDRESGQAAFNQLLDSLQIPLRKTENKIKRFYYQKYLTSLE
jgi:uncharacterized protein YjbK